jgi:hypothetical protein
MLAAAANAEQSDVFTTLDLLESGGSVHNPQTMHNDDLTPVNQ